MFVKWFGHSVRIVRININQASQYSRKDRMWSLWASGTNFMTSSTFPLIYPISSGDLIFFSSFSSATT